MSQAMQPTYFPLLDRPTPPGVRNLQSSIEEAWKHGTPHIVFCKAYVDNRRSPGYDPEGAEQLKHRLVGTGKYIGTGGLSASQIAALRPADAPCPDLYAAFTYRGIP